MFWKRCSLLLKREGYQIETVNSPKAVLERLHSREYDVLLMDLNYALDTSSGQEGLDLLARVQKLDNTLPVVVMTAWGSIPLAVEAMRRGAADFVEKPWDNLQTAFDAAHADRIAQRAAQRRGARVRRNRGSQCHAARAAAARDSAVSGIRHFGRLASGRRGERRLSGCAALDANHLALCVADVIGKGVPRRC
jgi:FixJ family two-component response regulator